MGEETPAFRNVRAYDLSPLDALSYNVALEGDVSMACDRFCLVLKARIRGIGWVEVALSVSLCVCV